MSASRLLSSHLVVSVRCQKPFPSLILFSFPSGFAQVFFLLAPWFSQLVSVFPRLSTLFISLFRSLSLCLPPLSLSCHPPSSLPIRICGAGDQSQRDVFSSTAAITQNSISPILK